MAVGGTGDLLSGVVATYLDSQDPFDAACMASFTTGTAGDSLYDANGTGYVASDVLERIPTVLGNQTDR